MIVLGLTGGIGTGKTTVAKMFASLGVKVIDADKIARSVVKPGSDVCGKLQVIFGEEIFKGDGTINRKRLAEIVFKEEPRKLKQLNSIIHPEVINIILKKIENARGKGARGVVIDAPLLIESGLEKNVDKVIVVSTAPETQEERSRRKHRLGIEELRARISSQSPLSEKEKVADYIVDNNGSLENTNKQVLEIWEGIR